MVTHADRNSCGLVPPCVRSYWISRSPAVRTGVTPLAEMRARLVELEVHVRRAHGSWTRCQNRFRKPGRRSSRGTHRSSAGRSCWAGCCRRPRRDGGVLLGALAERVVVRAGWLHRPCASRRRWPSPERWRRVVDLQVGVVVDLEVASRQRASGCWPARPFRRGRSSPQQRQEGRTIERRGRGLERLNVTIE